MMLWACFILPSLMGSSCVEHHQLMMPPCLKSVLSDAANKCFGRIWSRKSGCSMRMISIDQVNGSVDASCICGMALWGLWLHFGISLLQIWTHHLARLWPLTEKSSSYGHTCAHTTCDTSSLLQLYTASDVHKAAQYRIVHWQCWECKRTKLSGA